MNFDVTGLTIAAVDVTGITTEAPASSGHLSAARWMLIVLLWITASVTFVGNLLVILCFVFEKKLFRVNFNIYILNLAVTDVLVSCMAIPFYAIDYYMGRWLFNEVTCAIWIFFDWGMTFASIFTLVAISIDRYWAACWPNSYRKHNNRKKRTVCTVSLVWITLLVVWVPPWLLDRISVSEPGVCLWAVANNKEFAVFVAFAGYHGPSIIMLFCYVKVFRVMQKSATAFGTRKVVPVLEATATTDTDGTVTGDSQAGPAAASRQRHFLAKERKIFISLSYIIIAYLVCWSPFHVVFDVLLFDENAVSVEWYSFASWMCYINSMLNPILYAASSDVFREAFKAILTGKVCKRC